MKFTITLRTEGSRYGDKFAMERRSCDTNFFMSLRKVDWDHIGILVDGSSFPKTGKGPQWNIGR